MVFHAYKHYQSPPVSRAISAHPDSPFCPLLAMRSYLALRGRSPGPFSSFHVGLQLLNLPLVVSFGNLWHRQVSLLYAIRGIAFELEWQLPRQCNGYLKRKSSVWVAGSRRPLRNTFVFQCFIYNDSQFRGLFWSCP